MRRHPPPPTGRHTGWSPTRNRTAQTRFRAALINRSHGHCEHCGTTQGPMQAHHTKTGYTPDSGLLLCRSCHQLHDPHAR